MDQLLDDDGHPTGYLVGPPLTGAEGGLGTIFVTIEESSGQETRLLYKQYRAAALADHLREFLAHLGLPQQVRLLDYIPARPHQLVRRAGTAEVGLLMQRLGGNRLTAAAIRTAPLSRRIRWSLQLAVELGILHAHGIVHGDLNEPNILIDDDDLHLIDIDTCGVLAPDRQDFLPHLRTQVRGKETDPWLLASTDGDPPPPSIQTDRCYLTGLLYALLAGPPMSPLALMGSNEGEVMVGRVRWPVEPDQAPPRFTGRATEVRTRLDVLSPALRQHLASLLDRQGSSAFVPERAVSAHVWARDLHEAWRHISTCHNTSCSRSSVEFVALRRARCPACSEPLHRVLVR